ncbi:MAG TPA: acyl-CoA synthetase [Caulobacteraceae bacterium]|nr:acyl-CoA synthetase [Caulobacteraceae bacterium]
MGEVISGARRVSSEALAARAANAASGLKSLGVGAGDRVALYLRNDIAFFEAAFGAGQLGAYAVPVNWHYTPAEAAYLFNDSGAKAVVIHADLLGPIREAIPAGVAVLTVDTPPEIAAAYGLDPERCAAPPGATAWDHWVDRFAPAAEALEPPGAIIYTSGTTGHPKGVKRSPPSAAQTQASQGMLMAAFGLAPDAGIVTVVTGPMYHSAPNAYGLTMARLGARVILQPRFDPEGLLSLIETERVTHLHMVPIMFNRLLKLPAEVRRRYDLSSLKFVVHAAAPCPPHEKRAMIEWWGPVIYEYYGATETGAIVLCNSEEWLAHPGTVGKALPGCVVKVVDEAGNELPRGEVGEIVGRNVNLADFTYHGDDDKRRRAEKAGLIIPGDIGWMDADGFLYLCDRSKDMIISGGVNIYPAEIEAELHGLKGVVDCAVFGIPDAEYGEAICAVIQPDPAVALTEADVRGHLRGRVAGYKMPRLIEFAADLPREDSGKIFKRKLREPYWAGLERRI